MSSWKPAAILGDKPLLFYSLKTITSVCNDVVVVGGHNINELNSLVNEFNSTPPSLLARKSYNFPSPLAKGRDGERSVYSSTSSITCIENKNYNSGMFISVKTGLAQCQNESVFIALADMPFVNIETYFKLIDFSENEGQTADVIYPVIINYSSEQKTKKGHPVLIKQKVKERILNETGDVILRDILKEFEGKKCLVTDSGINFDIDTEEDFEKAKKYYSHLKNI
jgi:CTP:molybdopterin cytidylyltransferase MocA